MDGYGKRVLVVEDDADSRQVLALLLIQAGYSVYEACDGLEAMNEMKRRRFDVVVTDYHMPRLNGLELLMLSRVAWPDLPVVIVSGGQSDMAEIAVQRGAFAWIRKPYEGAVLLEVVNEAARRATNDRTHAACGRCSA
ncbi:MAG TPA: response regulator [Nitrospiraceae bacterium]|jgi:CheY-like chemotaxis protein|nr:response regulator [Nitrospiraceae bacterium]